MRNSGRLRHAVVGRLLVMLSVLGLARECRAARIGVFADPEGTVAHLQIDPGVITPVHVVARDLEGGIVAWQLALEGSFLEIDAVLQLTTVLGGPAPWASECFMVGFDSGCVAATGGCVEDDPFGVMTLGFLAVEPVPDDQLICLTSLGSQPFSSVAYATCTEDFVVFELEPNPCYDVPDGWLVVNPSVPCEIVDVRTSSFGAVKSLFGS
jgi:hypothetical protein